MNKYVSFSVHETILLLCGFLKAEFCGYIIQLCVPPFQPDDDDDDDPDLKVDIGEPGDGKIYVSSHALVKNIEALCPDKDKDTESSIVSNSDSLGVLQDPRAATSGGCKKSSDAKAVAKTDEPVKYSLASTTNLQTCAGCVNPQQYTISATDIPHNGL